MKSNDIPTMVKSKDVNPWHIYFCFQLELGNRLYPCFSGPTKVPCNRINLRTGRGSFIEISTAETGTIQLEFRDLARVVEDNKFEVRIMYDVIERVPKVRWDYKGIK